MLDQFLETDAINASIVAAKTTKPTIVALESSSNLNQAQELIKGLNPKKKTLTLPAWDCEPYQPTSPSSEVMGSRSLAISKYLQLTEDIDQNLVIVTSIYSLLQKVDISWFKRSLTITLSVNDKIVPEELALKLVNIGYRRCDICSEIGDFSVRGYIIDIYHPTSSNMPTRIELWDDLIESIKPFDPIYQASQKTPYKTIEIVPTSEIPFDEEARKHFYSNIRQILKRHINENDRWISMLRQGNKVDGFEMMAPLFSKKMDNIFTRLDCPVIIAPDNLQSLLSDKINDITTNLSIRKSQTNKFVQNFDEYPALDYEKIYADLAEWEAILKKSEILNYAKSHQQKAFNNKLLKVNLKEDIEQHYPKKILISCHLDQNKKAVINHLESEKIPLNLITGFLTTSLQHGFYNDEVSLYTEQDLLGSAIVSQVKQKTKSRKKQKILDIDSLENGDFVVDEEHGIGQFKGLIQLEHEKVRHDCVLLIYGGGDKLLVPVENLDRLSLFSKAGSPTTLDRLGNANWQERKAKAKKDLMEYAHKLVASAADRHSIKILPMTVPEELVNFSFECGFQETPDQLLAMQDILNDLCSDRPQERLLCGDVGFGKTEVALRAAFVTAKNNHQVLMLCPTTLLAHQQERSFKARLAKWGIKVRAITRLVSSKDKTDYIDDFNTGKVDILIGTHALFSDKIAPKKLRLAIIDEEQHFGVKQKEKLKKISDSSHIFSLSATPIPRSLQMSLSEIRELSTIATPPPGRQAARTHVMPYDAASITEAIDLEISRKGQVFFVAPRIAGISKITDFIKATNDLRNNKSAQNSIGNFSESNPSKSKKEGKTAKKSDWDYVVAHGGLSATELEGAVKKFVNNEVSILVSTAIIESGLDIPNANTIIITDADAFGLAQLYQLRGRIGRSNRRGYCILLYKPDKDLTSNSRKRLMTMEKLDYLGAGFAIASHDMEIRGAGNLLGTQQSGHIKEIGVALYTKLFREAVLSQKSNVKTYDFSPEINFESALKLDIFIPNTYIESPSLKMKLYREISDIENMQELQETALSWRDRFGPIPASVQHIFETVRVKIACRKVGVTKMTVSSNGVKVSFAVDLINPDKVIEFVSKYPKICMVRPDDSLFIKMQWDKKLPTITSITKVNRLLDKLYRHFN